MGDKSASYIYLIGDSHLKHCYDKALETDEQNGLNFGYTNLDAVWNTDISQMGLIEEKYKNDEATYGQPLAVFIMCGSYELVLTKNPKLVAEKLKTIVQHINSTTVQFIVVCSILETRSSTRQDEILKNVRIVNKSLAKAFGNWSKVFFINIRPPGKIDELAGPESFHLHDTKYSHVYKRLLMTLEERIVPAIPNAILINKKKMINVSVVDEDVVVYPKEASIDKRLSEFKDLLLQDYKRNETRKDQLTQKFDKIKEQLDTLTREKEEILAAYKKLFGEDISQNDIDKIKG